jgi:hypothetical protein
VSTHTTELWMTSRDRDGTIAEVDVASDYGVDLCIRLSLSEGGSLDGPRAEAEVHLNPDQAERIANTMLAIVARHRELGNDPTWAAETIESGTL